MRKDAQWPRLRLSLAIGRIGKTYDLVVVDAEETWPCQVSTRQTLADALTPINLIAGLSGVGI